MSVQYRAIGWNRQKRIYDLVITLLVSSYLAIFVGLGSWIHPYATIETLLIRGLGTASFLLLHIILCIGPLCRMNKRFLPLLYNRRHLGVTMFLLALGHGLFALIQFHGYGNLNPFLSLLVSNQRYDSVPDFPFQQLGLLALIIFFFMAATSHDFWLHTLTPVVWKRLHMGVYLAYGLIVAHIVLGALQSERNPLLVGIVGFGLAVVLGLHLAAAIRERRIDNLIHIADGEGFVKVCDVTSIPSNRGKVISVGGERIALFHYDHKISALSNVCAHQNGPLGEGKVIDDCVTCPWHGYQYLPESGASPPPFTEKVAPFRTRVIDGWVFVHPQPAKPGTVLPPSKADAEEPSDLVDEFYIGYKTVAPPGLAKNIKQIVAGLSAVIAAVALVLVFAQNPYEPSAFEFQVYRDFEGVLEASPVPSLGVDRPGIDQGGGNPFSRYLLVAQGKHGLDQELTEYCDKKVQLKGSLIYREGLTMIELLPESLHLADSDMRHRDSQRLEDLGTYSLRGEILDSKCYLGVMNPGKGKVHRDCAVRCISGGIPPALLVSNGKGQRTVYILLGTDGRQINQEILNSIGEPLEIPGRVVRSGNTLFLQCEPSTFKRLE